LPEGFEVATSYVFRWQQPVQNGVLHWYIRRLTEDGAYFGYVHVRTRGITENRSFAAKLPEAARQRVLNAISELRSLKAVESLITHDADCMLGIGTAAQCEMVIACSHNDGSDAAALFGQIVDAMEPAMIESAGIERS
jgi:hypothetical protein